MKFLLPEKLGPRKKIWTIIQRLQSEAQAEAERNRIVATCSETLEALPNDNDSHENNINCITSTLLATTSSEFLLPTSQKIVLEDLQEPQNFSSSDTIAVVRNDGEVIYTDNINSLQQKTSMPTTPLTDSSLQAPSNFYHENIDVTLQQSTLTQTPQQANSSLESRSRFHQDDSHVTSMQVEEIDISYPSVPSLSPAQSHFIKETADTISSIFHRIRSSLDYQTSVPDKSDSTNIFVDEIKEDKQRKTCDSKQKVEAPHGRRNYNKDKSEYVRGNENKRSYRKEKYNNHNSYKIAVPHKIIESRKKLPIYKYKEQFLNVRK